MIRYLIIDDEPIAHDIIKGYCDLVPNMQLIKNCYDALEAFEFLNTNEVDLIFLDLNMPRKNGFECLLEIKKNQKFDDIAIAIYSTSSSEEDIENTFVSGANIYIKKPSDFTMLKKILSEIVTLNWQYHTSGLNKENFLLRM